MNGVQRLRPLGYCAPPPPWTSIVFGNTDLQEIKGLDERRRGDRGKCPDRGVRELDGDVTDLVGDEVHPDLGLPADGRVDVKVAPQLTDDVPVVFVEDLENDLFVSFLFFFFSIYIILWYFFTLPCMT